MIYRNYWDEESLRFTVIDNEIEYDLYTEPFVIDSVSAEFREPFYLIANLAIGGAFTDAYNLGDPGSGLPVSMQFPAEMYVDYIKVYEWNEQGEVHIGPPDFESGTFGLFTDETPTNNGLEIGVDSEIYVWEGTLAAGSIAPYEGENGISWTTTGLGWFGAGIMSSQPVNLFNFGDGFLKFMIKVPANVAFQIGVIDAWGNQNYVDFPANQTTYGLVRDGEWGQASIPVDDLRGLYIDLRMLSYEFVILEVSGAQCEFGLDDIYWEGGISEADENVVEIKNFELQQNFPNPFNPETNINYSLSEASHVKIEVYNIKGQKVKQLVNGRLSAGQHSVVWDGTDKSNTPVSSGIYFYKIQTDFGEDKKKCILLK